MTSRILCISLLTCMGLLTACQDHTALDEADLRDPDAMLSGGVSGLNYTPYYIDGFGITGDNGITGGGPNIFPATPERMPSGGGGETCCATFPAKWRPGLKVTVRWIANKKLDGVAWGSWYTAQAELPPYGKSTYGLWAIFLPGDRVKVMVRGSTAEGFTSVWTRPSDDDPYVATGIVDEEANKEAEARLEKERKMKEAYEKEVANKEKEQ